MRLPKPSAPFSPFVVGDNREGKVLPLPILIFSCSQRIRSLFSQTLLRGGLSLGVEFQTFLIFAGESLYSTDGVYLTDLTGRIQQKLTAGKLTELGL